MKGHTTMTTRRTYPAPRYTNPRDAARANAWRRAHLARVGVKAIAPCTCGCGFPSAYCPNASNASE